MGRAQPARLGREGRRRRRRPGLRGAAVGLVPQDHRRDRPRRRRLPPAARRSGGADTQRATRRQADHARGSRAVSSQPGLATRSLSWTLAATSVRTSSSRSSRSPARMPRGQLGVVGAAERAQPLRVRVATAPARARPPARGSAARWRRPGRGTTAGPRCRRARRRRPTPAPPRAARPWSGGRARSPRRGSTAGARALERRTGEQAEHVPLVLAHPPADGGELHRAGRPAQVAPRLHDADHAPLERAERLPPAQGLEVDRPAAGRLVGRRQLLAGGHAAGRQRRAEPPRPHAEPAEVLHRVAEVGQLPVEDRPQAVGADEEVAEAEVAVDDPRLVRARGRFASSQRKPELEGRVGLAEPVEHVAVLRHLIGRARGPATASVGMRWMAAIAAPTCAPSRGARRRPLVVAQQLAGDRLAVEPLDDHARRCRARSRRRPPRHPATGHPDVGRAPAAAPPRWPCRSPLELAVRPGRSRCRISGRRAPSDTRSNENVSRDAPPDSRTSPSIDRRAGRVRAVARAARVRRRSEAPQPLEGGSDPTTSARPRPSTAPRSSPQASDED